MRWNKIMEQYEGERKWVIMRRLSDGRKIPLSPVSGEGWDLGALKIASATDPTTWGLLGDALGRIPEQALYRYEAAPALALTGDMLVVDFDKVLDRNAVNSIDAVMLFDVLPTYTEVSMSRRGLHMYYRLSTPWTPPQKRFGALSVEVYTDRRFIAVTGLPCVVQGSRIVMEQHELRTITPDEAMNILIQFGYSGKDEPPRAEHTPRVATLTKSDEELIAAAHRFNKNFAALMRGEWQGLYPSQSEADCALCGALAKAGGSREQIERIWLSSGLFRPKLEREDYRRRTLDAVHAGEVHKAMMIEVETKLAAAKQILSEYAAPPTLKGVWMAIAHKAMSNDDYIPSRILLLAIDHVWGSNVASSVEGLIRTQYRRAKR